MARPQKFRHSREALDDPQIAEKLGRFVIEIETLRTQRKQIDDQIAAAYDAVDDAGFEKKFVRKNIALRAKETDVRRDEEEGSEAYEIAIEKGVSLACARSKPSSTQSYAEAKGRDAGSSSGRIAEFDSADAGSNPAPVASELTDTQEQPEEPAKQSGQRDDAVAFEDAGSSPDESPAADAAKSETMVGSASAPISNPQPSSLGKADTAGAESSPASAVLSKPGCLKLRDGHCRISFQTSALCAEYNMERMKARAA